MKADIIFTGMGPILILTSYETFEDPKFVGKLNVKGIVNGKCNMEQTEKGGIGL